jgi:hypothetical protein
MENSVSELGRINSIVLLRTQKLWLDIGILAQFSEGGFTITNHIGNSKAGHEVKC